MQSVSHLTFDCYGTLIDWRGGIETHLGELLRKRGLHASSQVFPVYVKLEAEEEGTYKRYNEVMADTAVRVAQHFGLDLSREEALEFADSVPSWAPFDDTVKTLRKLGDLGLKRIILSNIDTETLRKTISSNDLEVDGFITAEEIGSYKPAVGHWMSFLHKYNVEKSNMLHIAQSVYHDIIPVTSLGVATAWINRYNESSPLEVKPTYTFRSLGELTSLIV